MLARWCKLSRQPLQATSQLLRLLPQRESYPSAECRGRPQTAMLCTDVVDQGATTRARPPLRTSREPSASKCVRKTRDSCGEQQSLPTCRKHRESMLSHCCVSAGIRCHAGNHISRLDGIAGCQKHRHCVEGRVDAADVQPLMHMRHGI